MDVEVIEQAITTLEGVLGRARNDLLAQGTYLGDTKAECGGNRACFVGSLYYASPEVDPARTRAGIAYSWGWMIEQSKRTAFLKRAPSLRLALEQADAAAVRWRTNHGHPDKYGERWVSDAEDLFEDGPVGGCHEAAIIRGDCTFLDRLELARLVEEVCLDAIDSLRDMLLDGFSTAETPTVLVNA